MGAGMGGWDQGKEQLQAYSPPGTGTLMPQAPSSPGDGGVSGHG